MKNQELSTREDQAKWKRPADNRNGRVMGGMMLVLIGVALLAHKMDVFFLPRWVFSWQMIPILAGLYVGFKHSFRNPAWILPVMLGVIFLIDDFVPGISLRNYIWPIVIIAIGLWVILKPKHTHSTRYKGSPTMPPAGAYPNDDYTESGYYGDNVASGDDYLICTAIFSGVKRTVFSKNFKGGEVVSVFGGNDLNLSQADMQHPVVLETTQIFGGTTLVVPPHWEVRSEVVAIMGGVSDKRTMLPGGYDPSKVLIIKGTALFGGLDIKSY